MKICLQGHKREDGMLVSIGRQPDKGGRDIAIQAVRRGWAALAVEQRCFGERRGDCQRESLQALMLGRTLTGERAFDVIRAIDFIDTQDEFDAFQQTKRIIQAAGSGDRATLVEGDGGHRFYPQQAWPVIEQSRQRRQRD